MKNKSCIFSLLYSVCTPLVARRASYLSQLFPCVLQRVSVKLTVRVSSMFSLAVTSLLRCKIKATPAFVYLYSKLVTESLKSINKNIIPLNRNNKLAYFLSRETRYILVYPFYCFSKQFSAAVFLWR
jgi:hypothetical protein